MFKLPFHKKLLILLPLLVFAIYLAFPQRSGNLMDPVNHNYFSDLARSFMDARLDIDCPAGSNCQDLVEFEGRHYLYWPPVPAIVYMPLVKVFGNSTPDAVISCLFGSLNVLLILLIVTALSERHRLQLTAGQIALLGIFWAFGTVHWYMASVGNVWLISQTIAQTFLLSSVYLLTRRPVMTNVILAGLCFGLACYTRNNLVFSIFFLAGLGYITTRGLSSKRRLQFAILFLTPFFAMSMANMAYNHARFDKPFDNGLAFHNMDGYFKSNFETHGYLSTAYIPENFYVEVIKPPTLKLDPQFISFDPHGFGLIWASPLFLLSIVMLYSLFRSSATRLKNPRLEKDDLILMTSAVVSGSLIAILIFMVMGTGWVQFGSRYSLDYQFMILVVGLFSAKTLRHYALFAPAVICLLIASIYVNMLGVLIMVR